MPPWLVELLSRVPWKKVRWDLVWNTAKWLYERGGRLLRENLTEKERRDLLELMRKSKGRAGNLTEKQRLRFRELVRKALTGKKK